MTRRGAGMDLPGAKRIFFLISCEHGGRRIPPAYEPLFAGCEPLLASHRGYDRGALVLAREMAAVLRAPLVAASISRLLVDLNRSPGHPARFSEITRALPRAAQARIHRRYYLPYRQRVEQLITHALSHDMHVIHISVHSFTPVLDGHVRTADIGFLYDPAHPQEAALCTEWINALQARAPELRLRRNYPYRGSSDGLCNSLRRRYPPELYTGVELEVNQRHAVGGGRGWGQLRADLIGALLEVFDASDTESASLGGAAAPLLGAATPLTSALAARGLRGW